MKRVRYLIVRLKLYAGLPMKYGNIFVKIFLIYVLFSMASAASVPKIADFALNQYIIKLRLTSFR